jgi:hypothetical protein
MSGALQGQQSSSLPPGNAALAAALGLTIALNNDSPPIAYSVKGALSDAAGKQYATVSLTSRGLVSLRQEVSGNHNEVLIIDGGRGSVSDNTGSIKKVHAREAMKPFHLLPIADVLQQLARTSQVDPIVTTDQEAGCSRFSLKVSFTVDRRAPVQTLVLCVNVANREVLYEEEPYYFANIGSSHTLRRTFLQYSTMKSSTIPTTIRVSVDGQLLYSMQITSFDNAAETASSTFQISAGAR